jgi:hypothetical protein
MFVSKETAKERLEICYQCENFIPQISMCSLCHCIMPLKTKIADISCPIEKWKRVTESNISEDNVDISCCPPTDTPVVFIPVQNNNV